MIWQNAKQRVPHPTSESLTTTVCRVPKIETSFTDAALVGTGGWIRLAQMAKQSGLLTALCKGIRLKRRQRGASDEEMPWSLIASLAVGTGALTDLDALRTNQEEPVLLGLTEAPSGRSRQHRPSLSTSLLLRVTSRSFFDGTLMEVDGRLFEGGHKGYSGEPSYWFYSVFIGEI